MLLGLDVGTSGVGALATSAEDGTILAQASGAYTVSTPRPGWAEQDPEDWSATSRMAAEGDEIPRAWLPALHEGTEATGTLRDAMADELGLPRGLPVAAGGGDNAATAVGVGVGTPGQISASIGTSGVVFAPTAGFSPDPSGRVHASCHALPARTTSWR